MIARKFRFSVVIQNVPNIFQTNDYAKACHVFDVAVAMITGSKSKDTVCLFDGDKNSKKERFFNC